MEGAGGPGSGSPPDAGGWLPPEAASAAPPGPWEPSGRGAEGAHPPPGPDWPPPAAWQGGWTPEAQAGAPGAAPAPGAYGAQPPGAYGAQPPGYGVPPGGYGSPPAAGAWGYGGWPQQGWGVPHGPPQPGNGTAVAGFVCGVSGLTLVLISFGFSSLLSLGLGIAGIFLGRSGRKKVDRGETTQHRGLAQAGFVTGIIATILSILATAGWALLFSSAEFREGLEEDHLDGSPSAAAALLGPLAVRCARLLAG